MVPESDKWEKDIGGFFGLELPLYDNFPQWHEGRSIFLNSGRSALEYILRSLDGISRLWVPYYTCPTVLEPLTRLGIPYEFYSVNSNLEPEEWSLAGMEGGDWLLYTNYFGIKEKFIDDLCIEFCGRLILDQSLALYSPVRRGVPAFYSPRKFSGLPDGGVAVMDHPVLPVPDRDETASRAGFLFVRQESGADAASALCERSEEYLHKAGMCGMSLLTERLMRGIDYEQARCRRLENFHFLHEIFCDLNRLKIEEDSVSVPFCYPFWNSLPELRNELIDQRILVPLLWPEILETAPLLGMEHRLALNLLPLPIDQRYGCEDMKRIVDVIHAFYQ